MVDYTHLFTEFCDELKIMRASEAHWQYAKLAGASYFRDLLNADYTSSVPRELAARDSSIASLDIFAASEQSLHQRRKSDFETYFLDTYLFDLIGAAVADQQTDPVLYVYDPVLLANGQVSIQFIRGMLGALKARMIQDSATIKKNTVTGGTFAVDDGAVNIGVLAETSFSAKDHCLTGVIKYECIDDTVDAPVLTVRNIMAIADSLIETQIGEATTIPSDRPLTVAKPFEDGQTGIVTQLDLGPVVESGDGGNMFSATTVTKPSEGDSDKGKHYFSVTRMSGTGGNPDFRIRWYRKNTLLPSDIVAVSDVTGVAGSVNLTILGSKTIITTTFNKTNAAAALPLVDDVDNDIIFDIKSPRVGDKWKKPVTNDYAGKIATLVARRWRASLNSVGGGAETIVDTLGNPISIS